MNLLLFVPFALFHPLACRSMSWGRTVGAGALTILGVELIQPVFGRAFDVNDILLNLLGIVMTACLFFGCRAAGKRE